MKNDWGDIRKNVLGLAGFFALVAGALLAGGCAGERAETAGNIRVGVTCYDESDTFISELLDCFREELAEEAEGRAEIAVAVRDAAGSQRVQDDQVAELIEEGCRILLVNLVDRADPSEIIDLARESDVPIIFFNREPVAEDMLQWDRLYYVGADARQSGVMQGELAADVILSDPAIDRNRDGRIQYVVLEGEPGHQDAIIRTESAVDTLKSSGIELEKLSWRNANWNRAQAQNRMAQMIGQYRTQIELVLANNDDMALGAVDAYGKTNYTEANIPVFFGIDGTEVGLEAVIEGTLQATVYNDKEGQAEAMAKLVLALATGQGMDGLEFEKEQYIYLPYYKVTRENAEEFQAKGADS